MIKAMQCKHISDKDVLEFLSNNPYRRHSRFANDENSIIPSMPENTPARLALAKMKGLVKRGFVHSCACGCRGDFSITNKGRIYLHHLRKYEGEIK